MSRRLLVLAGMWHVGRLFKKRMREHPHKIIEWQKRLSLARALMGAPFPSVSLSLLLLLFLVHLSCSFPAVAWQVDLVDAYGLGLTAVAVDPGAHVILAGTSLDGSFLGAKLDGTCG